MADKDLENKVDDRDQKYYEDVFGKQEVSDNKVDDRDQEYYEDVFEDRGTSDDYNEEYAAEAVDPDLITRRDIEADDATSTGLGWLALALSIIGLFFLPIVMGIAGIIVGFIARAQGARGLGAWAIGIGAAVIILRLVAYPFL
ncbi:DUF4190 domain-containing protein [Pullulanibacillus sp. KACC 23026]|uniref:DUF4190 domain-containing protein n=1 Tax=Pullulanibacillus sp. KACC 23026 TaxID=3028315 RepID=UPI0023B1C323|nr:DUF4190 domain-containing protein [Pullulanibacillus sp. KACC 23026]WEG14254.1 DUF4190 domain-containing protein [Pullulanibacillus sp. KACC 23026]